MRLSGLIQPAVSILAIPAALAAVLVVAMPARAQTTAAEVVVVSGFRPEALGETAGSVAVIDQALIEQRGADHIEAVLGTAANVTMTSGASRGRFIQMRGIGDLEQFVDPKHFPSVGIRLDGIDLGGIASAAMLFDVEQIDVVRGPQGTRLGASALAGQVDIRSTRPGDAFNGFVDVGVGDYGMQRLGVAVGGPLAASVKGRLAIQNHSGDGYMENAFNGRDDTNGYDETSLRGRLQWSPRDNVSLDLSVLSFDSDNGYDAFSLDNTRTTYSDAPGQDDLGLTAIGLTNRWQLADGSTLELILNRVDSEVDYSFDEDWAFIGFCDGTACNPGDGFSNTDRYGRDRDDSSVDLRWLGELTAGGRELGIVLGLYAQGRDEVLRRQYYGPFSSSYATDRRAVYAELSIPVVEKLDMTLGLRRESFDDRYEDSFASSSASEDTLGTGEISFSYSASSRMVLYALMARGDKPGGVNTEASSVFGLVQPRFQAHLEPRLRFRGERLTNTEVGVKTTSRSGKIDIRVAVFDLERDQAQLESWFWDPVNFLWVGILDNADGDNRGLELDLDYRATDRWRIRASLGLLDTSIEQLTSFDLDLDDFTGRDGVEQTKAPGWNIFLGSDWLLGDDWRLAIDVEATDSQRFGYYHAGDIDSKTLMNFSLMRSLGATEFRIWARNLLDEDYSVHGLYFGNDPRSGYLPARYLQRGEPRLVGVGLRHNF